MDEAHVLTRYWRSPETLMLFWVLDKLDSLGFVRRGVCFRVSLRRSLFTPL
jgi:hypothetical protein